MWVTPIFVIVTETEQEHWDGWPGNPSLPVPSDISSPMSHLSSRCASKAPYTQKLRQRDHVNRGDGGQLGQANEVVPAHTQSKTGHVFLYFFFVQMKVFFQFCYQFPERGLCVKISEAVAPSAKATAVPLGVLKRLFIEVQEQTL